ncbi:MAG TPA: MarR family winged helix-turn-helix transcriptional regulator [Caldimonas sp.]|nr:MarR family winged helix-turn-helix transcriptional regulator [Caldimonas sp.]
MPNASDAAPKGCTNFKLRRLTRRVSQHYDRVVAASGLKTTQYSLLSQMEHLGPVRPSDLAAAMAMDNSTLTRNLQPLVASGWAEIGPGEDGRSRRVAITARGRAKRIEARREWKRAQLALNERLGAARVVALHALLDECLATLSETEPEMSDA